MGVPRLRITVEYRLANPYIVGQRLTPYAILSPTRYRGHMRSLLAHYAATTRLMPLPLYEERSGGGSKVYRYLVSSTAPLPAKLMSRMNVLGKYFGGPVVDLSHVERMLGDRELTIWYASSFLRTGIAVAGVEAKVLGCESYAQGARDDITAAATVNPHSLTICKLAEPRVKAVLVTLPHPSDALPAPEEAWNGRYAGQRYVDALEDLVKRLARDAGSIDPWRLSPFPGRSKNPVEALSITVEREDTRVPLPSDRDVRMLQAAARRLSAAMSNQQEWRRRRA